MQASTGRLLHRAGVQYVSEIHSVFTNTVTFHN